MGGLEVEKMEREKWRLFANLVLTIVATLFVRFFRIRLSDEAIEVVEQLLDIYIP